MKFTEKRLVKNLEGLQNLHVRNMYWLLFSQSPLDEVGFHEFPLFPDKWVREIEEDAQDFFIQLDSSPDQLNSFIEQSNSYRMGIYAELLMHYFLENYEKTTLLLANYQLIENKVTIGEIDFIFSWQDQIIHIEMAVKFYLCHQNSNEFKDWIGPSGNDNLHKKLKKVKEHQLQLTLSTQFQKESSIKPKPYFFLRGMFFNQEDHLPNWKNKALNNRSYIFLSEFLENNNYDDFYLLKRPNWMSALYQVNKEMDKVNSEAESILELIDRFKSLHLWEKNKKTTIMVVKDDWPFK